jgi:hypothetical protein
MTSMYLVQCGGKDAPVNLRVRKELRKIQATFSNFINKK